MRWALASVMSISCGLTGGCGFTGPAGISPEVDAAATGDAASDGAVALGDWGTPRRLTEIEDALWGDSAAAEYDDPSISDSGELLFATNAGDVRTMSADIYRAQRNPQTGIFESIERVPGLSTAGFDTTSHISHDGLTAMVGLNGNIMVSTRASEEDPWPQAALIGETTPGEINSGSVEGLGQLSDDGERLYFTSNRGDGILFELYVATRDGAGNYGDVQILANVNGGSDKVSPKVSRDELTLYWTDRSGTSQDIVMAIRDSVDDDFGAPELVTEINDSNFDDADFAASGDHRTAVLSSLRHSQTSMRLYITSR